jgi:hypothetical protein
MKVVTNNMTRARDFSNQKLQNAKFVNEKLTDANFSGSDLRGVDFGGADLTDANFTRARTGITPGNIVLIFILALAVSLISGYVAMLTGYTIETMLRSSDQKIRTAGFVAATLNIIFIVYALWRGGRNAITTLILPAVVIAMFTAIIVYVSGMGTGMAMVYLALSFILLVVMFIIGTVARAAAGSLSDLIFLVVALAGGVFGKSLGGGAAAVIMAIACALISKRALSGARGFNFLQSIAVYITSRLGTSFRNAKLNKADFSNSKIYNTDFSNADLSQVNWGDVKKRNCVMNQNWIKNDGTKKRKRG